MSYTELISRHKKWEQYRIHIGEKIKIKKLKITKNRFAFEQRKNKHMSEDRH